MQFLGCRCVLNNCFVSQQVTKHEYNFESSPEVYIPSIETLALHWDFATVTGSNGEGRFRVLDFSSGSAGNDYQENYLGDLNQSLKIHNARGDFFKTNDKPVRKEFVYSGKLGLPEELHPQDFVQVLTTDDVQFQRDDVPTRYFFNVEKSVYDAISNEMLNFFASIDDFNNLIGEPVNKYRSEYKDLSKLREIFFRKIGNTPNVEAYVDYYKWLDSAIGGMLTQLFPASANFSEELRTVIESHILERNKYHNKMPTLEMPSQDPEGTARGIRELTYDWEHGHAPVDPATLHNEHCLWHNERVERDDSRATSGTAAVDTDRGLIKDSAVRDTNGVTSLKKYDGTNWIVTGKRHYDIVTSQSYEGRTYATRRLAKPYKLEINKTQEIRGGINYSDSKKDILNKFRSSLRLLPVPKALKYKYHQSLINLALMESLILNLKMLLL